MDPISSKTALAAAGAAGEESLYVDDVFSTYLYDGTGAAQTITNGIDLAGEGGLVWLKARTSATNKNHALCDTERGINTGTSPNQAYRLVANLTNQQDSASGLGSFNSDGFSLAATTNNNQTSNTYASWTFRKAPGFFDVVTYTGNGTTQNISHNLGSVPGWIVVKRTDSAAEWTHLHRNDGTTWKQVSGFNTNTLPNANGTVWGSDVSTFVAPTASVFTVGQYGGVNASGGTYVAYIFAHDEQSFGENGDESIIKCGSYTGSTTVDLGFEPQWLLIKRADASAVWGMFDVMRGIVTPGGNDELLTANSSDAESPSNYGIDLTSTGFSTSATFGTSGGTYVYVAIRRPHKPPEAGTDVFAAAAANSSAPSFTAGFPVDMGWFWDRTNGIFTARVMDRFRGLKALQTRLTDAEFTQGSGNHFDYMDDWYDVALNSNFFSHMFKRAPGFFDMVAYTGTGSGRTISHNLGVVPELLIVKKRSLAGSWYVTGDDLNNYADHLKLESNAAASTNAGLWNSTAPTSSVFSVGSPAGINESGQTFIAYLFASLNGISKVGTYTGTGSNIDVDCGFTAGARFVLIKRTDSTGEWMCFDSVRGIVSGNDPVVRLNVNYQDITDTDYIDPLNSGFTVGTGQADLNDSGGTYLFLAIA